MCECVWRSAVIGFHVCICGRNSTEVVLCSHCTSGGTSDLFTHWHDHPGDLFKLVSVRLSIAKLLFFFNVISKYFVGWSFETIQISCFSSNFLYNSVDPWFPVWVNGLYSQSASLFILMLSVISISNLCVLTNHVHTDTSISNLICWICLYIFVSFFFESDKSHYP